MGLVLALNNSFLMMANLLMNLVLCRYISRKWLTYWLTVITFYALVAIFLHDLSSQSVPSFIKFLLLFTVCSLLAFEKNFVIFRHKLHISSYVILTGYCVYVIFAYTNDFFDLKFSGYSSNQIRTQLGFPHHLFVMALLIFLRFLKIGPVINIVIIFAIGQIYSSDLLRFSALFTIPYLLIYKNVKLTFIYSFVLIAASTLYVIISMEDLRSLEYVWVLNSFVDTSGYIDWLNLLLGHGPGFRTRLEVPLIIRGSELSYIDYYHSSFLYVFVKLGLLGLLIYILLLKKILYKLVIITTTNKELAFVLPMFILMETSTGGFLSKYGVSIIIFWTILYLEKLKISI